MRVLIFPSSTFEAVLFAKQLKKQGHYVVGASSLKGELNSEDLFDEHVFLTHITDAQFLESYTTLLNQSQITHFWTSVDSVYGITKITISKHNISFLCCDPMEVPVLPIEIIIPEIFERNSYLKILAENVDNDVIDEHFVYSTLFNVLSVPGQSHFDKLLTICQIFSTVPQNGDIIEIGSLWGRSAFLFGLLANRFSCGNILCIDPWPIDGITQNLDNFLEEYSVGVNSSVCFSHFCLKLSPLFSGKMNYIRDYSQNTRDKYLSLKQGVTTAEFGHVVYKRVISLLHIDGNHGYDAVKSDVEIWCPLVASGGWIIFDDYNWAYGGGPKGVIDEYLIAHSREIEMAFFSGGALFVKKY